MTTPYSNITIGPGATDERVRPEGRPERTEISCPCDFYADGDPQVVREAFDNHACPSPALPEMTAARFWDNLVDQVFGLLRGLAFIAAILYGIGILVTGHFLPWVG